MKALSLRLGQFAVCAVLVTVLFRYVLSLCIGMAACGRRCYAPPHTSG